MLCKDVWLLLLYVLHSNVYPNERSVCDCTHAALQCPRHFGLLQLCRVMLFWTRGRIEIIIVETPRYIVVCCFIIQNDKIQNRFYSYHLFPWIRFTHLQFIYGSSLPLPLSGIHKSSQPFLSL